MKTDVKINVHIISAVIQAVQNRGLLPDPSPRVLKYFRVLGECLMDSFGLGFVAKPKLYAVATLLS